MRPSQRWFRTLSRLVLQALASLSHAAGELLAAIGSAIRNLKSTIRNRRRPYQRPLRLESLERRQVLTATLSIDDPQVDEDAGTIVFTATLSEVCEEDVTFDFATEDITAESSADYISESDTLTILQGYTTAEIILDVVDSERDELLYETFAVNLSNAVGADIADAQGIGTIVDDDDPPQLIVTDQSTDENASTAQFLVELSAPSDLTVSIDLAYTSGTATTNDYDDGSAPTSISIDPGETEYLIPIGIYNDELKEPNEKFEIEFSNPQNVTIPDSEMEVTIIDDDAIGLLNINPLCGCMDILAGLVTYEVEIFPGLVLTYTTRDTGMLTIVGETVQPDDGPVPDKLEVTAGLYTPGSPTGPSAESTIWYDTSSLSAGDPMRFVHSIDASALTTGVYEWRIEVVEHHTAGTATRSFSGKYTHNDGLESPLGVGWSIAGLSQLLVTQAGVGFVRAGGANQYFASSGGAYTVPAWMRATFVENQDDTYTLTHKGGFTENFDAGGYLASRADTNGNKTNFSWSGGLLQSITDPAGRATTFTYSSGMLTTVTDFASRAVTLTRNGNDELTAITTPDPDGGGAQSASQWQFTYSGALGRMASAGDPNSKTTDYVYNNSGRIDSYERPDGSIQDVSAAVMVGMIDPTSGSGSEQNPASIVSPADVEGVFTDGLDNDTTFEFDAAYQIDTVTDALGNVTDYDRDVNTGDLLLLTLPDPDGAGPLGDQVFDYDYDAGGNVTDVTLPDSNTLEFTYDATFDRVTSQTDELGRVSLYEIDENTGNVLSITRVVGEIDDEINEETDDVTTTYTYTAKPTQAGDLPGGLLLTITDPLGRIQKYLYEDDDQDADFGRLLQIVYAFGTADETSEQYEYDAYGNVAAVIDGLSRRTEFLYDALDRLIEMTLPDPDGGGELESPEYAYTYDAAGNLLTETDALGNVTSYTYDELNRLLTVTQPDPDGGGAQTAPVTTYAYDDAGQLESVTDALGNVTAYQYDDAGQRTKIILPDLDGVGGEDPPEIVTTFDAAGNVATMTDALGNVTSYKYDILNRPIETTYADPDGGGAQASPVTSSTYDAAGQLTSQTDALGRVTSFQYDDLGRIVLTILPDLDGVGGEDPPEIAYEYDKAGNRTAVIDQLAGRTEYEYDSLNRLVKIIQADPDGGGALESPETVYAYDDASQLVSVTDPLGRVTTYEYDGLGRKTLVTLPDPDGVGGDDPPETAYSFDAAGNLLTGTDALGNVTEYQYDNLFRQILVIAPDPDGGGGLASPETEFSYDLLGRLTSATDALDRVTSYEYDVLGRRIKVVQPDPDGVGGEDPPETDYEYDLAGNLVSVTDPLGNVTTYAYDNLYRRVSTTQPDPDAGGALSAPVTSFTYDAAGNITSLTDPVGNVTSWVYDAHNRAIEETNELLDTRYFEYDVAGNLIEKTDRNGLVTEFAYDDLYRLTTETWKDGETTVNTLDFTYDAASQMLTAADDVSSYEYTYNGLGQVTLIEIDNGGPLVELVQEFTPVGSRSLLAASFDDGGGMDDDFQNIFYYDNIQRLVQIDQSGVQGGNTVAEKRVNFAYNAAGQLTSIARYKDLDGGSGNLVATTSFVYDGIARLTDLTHTHDTTTIADYDWDYDAFSRVTSMSFTALVGDDGSSAYTYDDTNQLTDADHDFQTDEAYEYDENGNRTMSGYVVGDNNLTTSDGTYDYEYDDEGNRTKKTHSSSGDYVTYEWDHRNRLVGVEFRTSAHALTKRVEYEYDLFNRRILKRVDDDGDTNFDWAQRFVYDGDSIVLVFDDASSLTNRYLHGPAVDQILADEDSLGEVLWPLADNLGTIRDLVDSDGDVVNHLTYNAFGAITSQTAPSLEPLYTYTGREWDPDVELYFYRARWYDPALGQFISEDPIGFVANDPNIRRYTSNNPVRYTDPTGMLKYDKSLKPFFDAYGYPHNWTGWIEQTTNNVQPATPASTARVFVLKKDVDQALQHKGITVYHLSIMLVSDVDLTSLTGIGFKQYNGKDLPFLKNGQYYMTIGAYPTGMGYGTSDEQLLLDIVRGKAKLECSFNHPYDVPSRDLITVAEIAARKDSGLSSDALFRLLIIRAVLYRQKYQSTYTYTMIPGIGSEGHNSNSFVTSLLLHSGIYPPEFMDSPPVEGGGGVREVPGFMDIIPIGPPGPNWDDEIIIIQGRLRQ